MLSKVHGPSTLSRAFSTSKREVVDPIEQIAFDGLWHRRQKPVDEHPRDVPWSFFRSAERILPPRFVKDPHAREAAKRRIPGVADGGLAGGVPEDEEASVGDPYLVPAERSPLARPTLVELDCADRRRGRDWRLARIRPADREAL